MLAELEREILSVERQVAQRVGRAKQIAEAGALAKKEITDWQIQIEALDEAVGVFNSFADERQEQVQRQIEVLVTHGLQTIFGADMSFHITSEMKARRAEVNFVIRSKIGSETFETPILEARGGGVAAVAGFLLRLIILLLHKEARPVLFLDESFAQLSVEYEQGLADFLRELVDKSPVQILMVTHSTAFDDVADIAYRFSLVSGHTEIVKV